MINLTDNITKLPGISDKRAALYKKMGVETVGELITHYPRGYIDFTSPIAIGNISGEENAVIRAFVSKKMRPYLGKITVYKLMLTDESGSITGTFFNGEYNYTRLILGREYIFYGRVSVNQFGQEIINPIYIPVDEVNKLIPKYRLTAGLSQAIVSANIKTAFDLLKEFPFSDLPEEIREEYSLLSHGEAMVKIHFPASSEESNVAKRSLVFKELLILQLGLAMIRSRNRKLTGAQMGLKSEQKQLEGFYSTLPFKPTNAQIRAVNDCIRDMGKQIPMNRLLQGDVGSGKTMVAAALAYYADLNGFQTALMVPTEILANQHYKSLVDFLEPHGIKTVLITGGMSAAEKRERRALIKSGEAGVVVGTHALIQKGVEFASLGLVVTDEQHRFGVGQRSELISKGANPHTLVMSATPIPRTLGLIIYGDLDISLLDEMPKGRLPIKTYGVNSSYRERIYKFIINHVNEGRQAYIVCPLIEESMVSEKTGAVKYYNELRESWFRQIPTGLLHGRMKQTEKDTVMEKFKGGEIMVLVSTTVIEVGVDVPNSVVMLIENAEQFGLSQLHQLRGRVGRGSEQSYCILITDSDSPYTKARIDTMSETSDGFEIAGKDLELRGPGDFFGKKQHGLPLMKIGDMTSDTLILEETQSLARNIIKDDPELSENVELRQLVAELFKETSEYGFN